jgi:hypothetical protein
LHQYIIARGNLRTLCPRFPLFANTQLQIDSDTPSSSFSFLNQKGAPMFDAPSVLLFCFSP